MITRKTREENKENKENSVWNYRQIRLHLPFEEPIFLLVFLSFLWCFSLCEPPFFVQTVFYLQSTCFDLILVEIRSLKSLENDDVLHQEVLPIDRLIPAIDRLRICLGLTQTLDRWARMLRSIGALAVELRVTWPIDRLVFCDRSAIVLLTLEIPADRSANCARLIGDGSVLYLRFFFAPNCFVLCAFSSRFPYLCLNHCTLTKLIKTRKT